MRVVVLNSTQPKHPHAGLPWVRATLQAVDTLAAEGHGFVGSVGTAAWELALWRAGVCGAALHILCPLPPGSAEQDVKHAVLRDFDLSPERCSWHLLPATGRSGRGKDTWTLRDSAALSAAECIYPVSLRPGGKLAQALSSGTSPRPIDLRFTVPFLKRPPGPGWQGPEALQLPLARPMLLHFTRTSDGPWPGERRAQYFADVASSPSYPRDGFGTLRRIVREHTLRASRFRIRAGAATVSFTALDPSRALGLVRWRSRYARFSFEPFAVGVSLEAAERAGARPVVYDRGACCGEAADGLHQGRGEAGHWEAEQEWRHEGDLDLARFDAADVALFTGTDRQAAQLRPTCGWEVFSFGCRESGGVRGSA
jgi:hypothetical protein